jgi:hypothetical protein
MMNTTTILSDEDRERLEDLAGELEERYDLTPPPSRQVTIDLLRKLAQQHYGVEGAAAARAEESARIHAALKEQAEEYRREAGEARRRGDQGGWEKLTAAQSVVSVVTRIIFDSEPADQGEHRG